MIVILCMVVVAVVAVGGAYCGLMGAQARAWMQERLGASYEPVLTGQSYTPRLQKTRGFGSGMRDVLARFRGSMARSRGDDSNRGSSSWWGGRGGGGGGARVHYRNSLEEGGALTQPAAPYMDESELFTLEDLEDGEEGGSGATPYTGYGGDYTSRVKAALRRGNKVGRGLHTGVWQQACRGGLRRACGWASVVGVKDCGDSPACMGARSISHGRLLSRARLCRILPLRMNRKWR